jgi:hypothetical protein
MSKKHGTPTKPRPSDVIDYEAALLILHIRRNLNEGMRVTRELGRDMAIRLIILKYFTH